MPAGLQPHRSRHATRTRPARPTPRSCAKHGALGCGVGRRWRRVGPWRVDRHVEGLSCAFVVPPSPAACGVVRLEGRRSRACGWSRGRRPSGCDIEPTGGRAGLPERHPGAVVRPLTRTRPRPACRLQRPYSSLVLRASEHSRRQSSATTGRGRSTARKLLERAGAGSEPGCSDTPSVGPRKGPVVAMRGMFVSNDGGLLAAADSRL